MMTDKKYGLIFDMDGVLVDSEPAGIYASMEVIKSLGYECYPEEFKQFTGMGDDKFIGGVLELHGGTYCKDYKAEMYRIYTEKAREKVHVYDWSKKIIDELIQEGFLVSVASASDYVKVKCNIDCIGIDIESLSAVVTGSDITRNKPAPDIFLKAAEKSGLDPKSCIVTEDSVAGIKAAKAAGMKAVGVTTTFAEKDLYDAGADIVLDSLDILPIVVSGLINKSI